MSAEKIKTGNIKIIEQNEVEELQEMSKRTFIDSYAADNEEKYINDFMSEAFSQNTLSQELQSEEIDFYWYIYEGRKVAYLKLNRAKAQSEKLPTIPKPSLEIHKIYILKPYQGNGIGKELMDFTFELAREQGFNSIWLGVWPKNKRAIQFYQSYGFKYFGKHTFHLGEDVQEDFLMLLEL